MLGSMQVGESKSVSWRGSIELEHNPLTTSAHTEGPFSLELTSLCMRVARRQVLLDPQSSLDALDKKSVQRLYGKRPAVADLISESLLPPKPNAKVNCNGIE